MLENLDCYNCIVLPSEYTTVFLFPAGKICLDILRLPPNGSYNPAITLESILLSIQLLLASPNPDDPLQSNIADVYKHDRETFYKNAREYTEKYATDDCEPEVKKKKTYS